MDKKEGIIITEEDLNNTLPEQREIAGGKPDTIIVSQAELVPKLEQIEAEIRLVKRDDLYWKNFLFLFEAYKKLEDSLKVRILTRKIRLYQSPRNKTVGDLELSKNIAQLKQNPDISPFYSQYVHEQLRYLNQSCATKEFNQPGLPSHSSQKYTGEEINGKHIWSCVPCSIYNGLRQFNLISRESEDDIIEELGGFDIFDDRKGMSFHYIPPILRNRGLLASYTSNIAEIVGSIVRGNFALMATQEHCVLISGVKSDGKDIIFVVNDPLNKTRSETKTAFEIVSCIQPIDQESKNVILVEKDFSIKFPEKEYPSLGVVEA